MLNREDKQLHWIYYEAKRRCTNPKHKRFKDYGGRGIEFNFVSYEQFISHLGPRPLTLNQIVLIMMGIMRLVMFVGLIFLLNKKTNERTSQIQAE